MTPVAEWWRGRTPAVRLALLAVASLLVGLAVVAGPHLAHRDMRPLMTGLSAEEASQVVSKLDELKVGYTLSDGGASVLVSASDLYRARLELAGAGLPGRSGDGFGLFDRLQMHGSDFAERVNYQRALQGELAATISALPEVRAARVHLNLPPQAVFLSEERKPSASVLIDLKPGARLSPDKARAVVRLVAGAVEGLPAESVSLMDTAGSLLHLEEEPQGGDEASRSQQMQAQAQALLDGVLGPGRALASVRVELVKDRRRIEKETFEPGQSLVRERKQTAETYAGGRPPQAPPAPPPAGNAPSYQQTSDQVTYELSRSTETVEISPGKVERVFASVLVDEAAKLDAAALASLGTAVQMGLGLDTARGDRFEIKALAFNRDLLRQEQAAMEAAEAAAKAEREQMLKLAAGGAVGGVVLLVVLALALRRRQPASAAAETRVSVRLPEEAPPGVLPPAPERPALESGVASEELRGQALQAARTDPEATARLIESWLTEKRS